MNQKTGYQQKNTNNSFRKSTRIINLFLVIMLITSVLLPIACSTRGNQIWSTTLNINEPGGAFDTVIFSEAPDATDGPPQDTYDLPKPIPPMPPYIRAWFNDGLAQPFDSLWEDCRYYPDTTKTWSLSVQWFPQDYISTTTITISWDTTTLSNSEYNSIHLYQGGSFVADMLTQSSYTFPAPALAPTSFSIICNTVGNQPPFAVNDIDSTLENNPVDINVSDNDYDLDGTIDYSSIDVTTPPSHGSHFIQPNTGIVTYTPTPGYSGQDTFFYTIDDDQGATSNLAQVNITITHINQPPTVSDIPAQTINEGSLFTQIILDNYVDDLEDPDSAIQWTATGNTALSVSIINRIAIITAPHNDWNGAETITFIAEDTLGLTDQDSALFTIDPVNDAPSVSDIPDQTIPEGGIFTKISLDDYVVDIDNNDNEIIWTPTGQSALSITIDVNRIATITTPGPDWNGAETITFTAEDPGTLSDSDNTILTVSGTNDPPVVSNIPDQTIPEGQTFIQINLDDYVTDIEDQDSSITWTATGQTDLTIDIINRIATITIPNSDWNGAETITFTAEDTGALTDTDDVTLTVSPVNDAPIISDIPDQTIADGQTFNTINLDQYVDDVDNPDASITWTSSGNTDLTVTIDGNRIATITIPTSWTGSETISFEAEDPEGLTDQDSATFTVTIGNYPPEVDDIPDQSIPEGQTFTTIDLNQYVTDVEDPDSAITWSSSTSTAYTTNIDGNNIASITILDQDWNGAESITFTATDTGGLSDSDDATFTITPVNDPPTAQDIPDQTIPEGSTFTQITLDNYVTDIDNTPTEMAWIATGQTDLIVTILPSRIATIETPNSNWNGAETITFTVEDPGNLSDSNDATFTVTAGNDPPVVSNIPDQTISEGQTFTQINLDDYVTDIEDPDSAITWTSTGQTDLTVDIVNRIATITIPNSNWNGAETITFTAEDTGALTDTDDATFTVTPENDAPTAQNIPDQTISEGGTFTTIPLNDYVTDIDNLPSEHTWTATGNTDLQITISPLQIATITTPTADWNGAETITFTVEDLGGLTDSDDATFTVIAGNDPPIVDDIPDQSILEGQTFTQINLDNYVEDPEDPDNLITWTYSGNIDLIITINNRIATIAIPDPEWSGLESITFTATDTAMLSDQDIALFEVIAQNDPPTTTNDNYNVNENSIDNILPVLINDDDIENDPIHITSVSPATHGITSHNGQTITYSPTPGYSGPDSFTYTIADDNGSTDVIGNVDIIIQTNEQPTTPITPTENSSDGSE